MFVGTSSKSNHENVVNKNTDEISNVSLTTVIQTAIENFNSSVRTTTSQWFSGWDNTKSTSNNEDLDASILEVDRINLRKTKSFNSSFDIKKKQGDESSDMALAKHEQHSLNKPIPIIKRGYSCIEVSSRTSNDVNLRNINSSARPHTNVSHLSSVSEVTTTEASSTNKGKITETKIKPNQSKNNKLKKKITNNKRRT